MELITALLIYLVSLVVTFMIGRYFKITYWSSFVLSVVVSSLILSLVYPATRLTYSKNPTLNSIYLIIGLVTLFVIYWYLFERIFTDRECVYKLDYCQY